MGDAQSTLCVASVQSFEVGYVFLHSVITRVPLQVTKEHFFFYKSNPEDVLFKR